MKEVPQVFQAAIHGYYAYHIYRNLVDTFKDKSLEIYYWQAVKTCRRADFDKFMHHIELANPLVHAWLREIGYEKWVSSHFPGKRFNLVTTNIVECVNALFKEAREYPVTMLIETVRLKIQEMFCKRRELASSFVGPLTPWAEKQIKDLIPKARDVRCHAISRDEYYIVGDYNDTVKLNEFSCTYREFEVKGLPCFHVLSACINYNLLHYSYCSPLYTARNYQITYENSVYPVRDQSQWEISPAFKEYCSRIRPPLQMRSAGRPKKARILSRGEERTTKICGRCKQTGHNRRSCKFPIPSK
ncbi:uncharacterized protein LOC131225947 [Magnolia sinica]|uniref:uncharacterized protein LOC131225947 n=1 Tax=Magnolia sinica TaxID=86752 RepID=UPI00265A1674|nr:uncharacterized protein LOC131225947 [Magnolia sinica]